VTERGVTIKTASLPVRVTNSPGGSEPERLSRAAKYGEEGIHAALGRRRRDRSGTTHVGEDCKDSTRFVAGKCTSLWFRMYRRARFACEKV